MQIRVEFLEAHVSAIYDVGRVPCVGEFVVDEPDGECYEVKEVIHILDPAGSTANVFAIVRVK